MRTPRTVHGWAHWGVNGLIAALLLLLAAGMVSDYATATRGQPQPAPTVQPVPEAAQAVRLLATEAAFQLPERPYRGITVVLRGPALDARRQLVAGNHAAHPLAQAPVVLPAPRAEAAVAEISPGNVAETVNKGLDVLEIVLSIAATFLGGGWAVAYTILRQHKAKAQAANQQVAELVSAIRHAPVKNGDVKTAAVNKGLSGAITALRDLPDHEDLGYLEAQARARG